ncbi:MULTISPECIES: siderophore-interacting protein [Actinomadura]|uniref:Siderophore-interacting protein n=1 Tax=Actinomadura yumaensis TaxID=111807 RepID=A0ABW2CNJ1_9ACTN|nr:siderophore-interacting protein [Actinomadura sp. J1-007]MWK36867.1 siderophore-interacting protein [Actinomadura sp. J1-007]
MRDGVRYHDLTVARVTDVTPRMRRITFTGPDLADFASVAPDQQVKLFLPPPGRSAPDVPPLPEDGDLVRWYAAYREMDPAVRPYMRTYSVRAHRTDPPRIDIDFVLHGPVGPGSRWAGDAAVGRRIAMIGPAPSHKRVPAAYDWMLLAGDESALPAIAATLEALPAGLPVQAFVEIDGPAEEQRLDTAADLSLAYVHRDGAHGDRLVRAVAEHHIRLGLPYVWLAGEAATVRRLRRHFVAERAVPKSAIAFVGYWRRGTAQDAPPTSEDLADEREAH